MARYFVEIVAGVVDRIVVGGDSDTTSTIGTLLGGTWIETADPYVTRFAYPPLGLASNLVQPPVTDGVTTFSSAATKIVDTADYAAWPFNLMHYDSVRDKLWFCYMDADDHVSGTSEVMFATINTTTDAVSTPVVAVSDVTYKCVCHSACIAANGDYLLCVMYRDTTTGETMFSRLWRSTDGGANWTNEGDLLDSEGVSVGVRYQHAMFVTAAGTILLNDTDEGTTTCRFHRSTDNGATWSAAISVTNNIAGTEPLEPAFWQHPTSGRIIAVVRAGLSGSQPNPLFTYSDDDGLTWAALTEAPDWWRQYSNPAAFVYHADANLVEVFVGHRRYDGIIARLFRTAATPDDAANLDFGGMDLLYGGTSTNNDFGYVAAARVGSKVYLLWYDGSDTDTDIWMVVGTRS